MIRSVLVILGLGMALSLPVHAAKSGDFKKFGANASGNSVSIGTTGGPTLYGSAGTAKPPANMSGWTPAGNYGVATSATGPTMYGTYGGETIFAGTKYPWQAAYTAPVSNITDAVLGLARGPWGLAATLAIPLVLDWFNKSGGRINPVTGEIERSDPTICTVAPCYDYRVQTYPTGSTPEAACKSYLSQYSAESTLYNRTYLRATTTECHYAQYRKSGVLDWGDSFQTISALSVSPKPANWLPSSMDDIAPYMSARAPDAGVIQQILDKGGDIKIPDPVVTGPSSVTGPPTVTNNPDGSKTTSSTTSNYTNSGNTITNTSNVTTVTVNNVDNSVRSVSTTTTTPEPKEEGQANDTALPDQPTLYKRQYPDGLTGVWNTKKAELLATPLLQLTSNLQPTIAAPSGYPMWPVPVVIGHWNFGTYDVSPASYVWDFLKLCTIIGALFLARALIFGG